MSYEHGDSSRGLERRYRNRISAAGRPGYVEGLSEKSDFLEFCIGSLGRVINSSPKAWGISITAPAQAHRLGAVTPAAY